MLAVEAPSAWRRRTWWLLILAFVIAAAGAALIGGGARRERLAVGGPAPASAESAPVAAPTFPFGEDPLIGGKEYDSFEAARTDAERQVEKLGVHAEIYGLNGLSDKFRVFLAATSIAAVSDQMTIIESVGAWSSKIANSLNDGINGNTEVTGGSSRVETLDDGSVYLLAHSPTGDQLIFGGDGTIVQILVKPGSEAATRGDAALQDSMAALLKGKETIGDPASPSAADASSP